MRPIPNFEGFFCKSFKSLTCSSRYTSRELLSNLYNRWPIITYNIYVQLQMYKKYCYRTIQLTMDTQKILKNIEKIM